MAKCELTFRPGVTTQVDIDDHSLLFYAAHRKTAEVPDQTRVIQDALENNWPLIVKLEKEGNFWNIKEAEFSTETKVSPDGERPREIEPDKKADDIMLAVAFKGAIDLETHQVPEAEPNTKRVLKTTTILLAGLNLLRGKKE